MLQGIASNMASSTAGSAQGSAQQGITNVSNNHWVKYFFVVFLLGMGSSATGFITPQEPQVIFLMNIALYFLLGMWHWARMKKEGPAQESFVSYLIWVSLVSLIVAAGGYLLGYFLLVKNFSSIFAEKAYLWLEVTALLATLLPTAIQLTFESIAAIPHREYKKWFYPEKTIIMDESTDLSNIVLITFVFSKKAGDTEKSNLQSKGPYGIKLGDLFYFFIQEWNHRNPEKQIEFLDRNNKSFGWYFTTGKSWWSGKKYLDPELTIRENNIKVNLIIETERVVN